MAVISEYEEHEEATSTPRPAQRSEPAVNPKPEEQPRTLPPSPSPSPSEEEVGNHDAALRALLDRHRRRPLELLTTVFEFLFRETDLSREPGVDHRVSAIVAAAERRRRRRSACGGDDDVAPEKAAKADATRNPKPKKEPTAPCPTPRGGETVDGGADEPPAHKEPGAEQAGFDSEGTGLHPNVGNGFDHETYSWTQTLGEVTLHIRVPKGTKSKAVECEIKRNSFKAGVKGQQPILQGEFFQHVKVDDCFWSLDEDGTLSIYLTKFNQMKWWRSVVKGEPEINTRKVEPEKSRLDDLDAESRATAEKMMYDQRQKALGLPTSEESSKNEALKQFMAHHPEMDFSKVMRG